MQSLVTLFYFKQCTHERDSKDARFNGLWNKQHNFDIYSCIEYDEIVIEM